MSEARGFPAFAAQKGRSTRGRSWWARSWVEALEDTSLDAEQLRRGRRYANSGQVGTITVSPGRIAAPVYSPEDTYEAEVLVDQLSGEDWGRFLDEVAGRAGHVAALLDGEMPHDLVEAAADAGAPLLPGIGDLDPSCTCDAWELPCQHAAGLCYQVAWLLDADPFVLLLIRGRSREDLLDDLQNRMQADVGAVRSEDTAGEQAGGAACGVGGSGWVPVSEVQEPVGDLPELGDVPGRVAADDLAVAGIESPTGIGERVLQLLVLDAARRARAQLSAVLAGAPEPWVLDEWQDAVRLSAEYPELAQRLGVERDDAVQAWRYGGAPALEVLDHAWEPDAAELTRVRAELAAAADEPVKLVVEGNRITVQALQLRLDRAGRWHPYRRGAAGWVPAGPPERDPVTALSLDSG